MKNIILVLLIFSLSNSFSQVPLIERSFMPMFNSGLNSVVHDSLGYFYSAASSLGGSFDAPGFIVKHDQRGNIQFEKYYSYDDTYLNDLLITPDENIVVCGYSSGCDFGYASGLIFKITPYGDTLWTKKINTHSIGTLVDNKLLKIIIVRLNYKGFPLNT